jgi:hypothetical protein
MQRIPPRSAIIYTEVLSPGSHQPHSQVCQPDLQRGIYSRAGVAALATVLLCQLASALPSFEPFADATANGGTSYAVGSTLTNQFNPTLFSPWYSRGANFPGATPLMVADNLSYPGLPASTGNSVSFVPALATSACLDLNQPVGGQPEMVFCSFLLKIIDLSAVPTSPVNNPFAAFGDDPAHIGNQIGRLGCRVLTKKVGTGFVLGTSMTQLTADFVYEPDASAHPVGEVLFVVQGYQQTANVQTNVYLWINPPASSFGGSTPPTPTVIAPYAAAGLNGALNNNGARSFALLCQFATAPSGVIDELRVGTQWGLVTGGPGIYAQPTNQNANAGSTVVFTVGAFGGTPLRYQWQKDGAELGDGPNISGATTATLSLNNVLQAGAGEYSVAVTNTYGTASSSLATLTVNDPFITNQPTNQTVAYGATAVLHVAAAGTPVLTYQWSKDGFPLNDDGRISGSLTPTLTITGFSGTDIGLYNAIVFNGLGSSVTSSNAQLQATDPSISAQPVSVTNLYGTTATFQVTAAGTGPFSYLWHRAGFGDLNDGGNIAGSHTRQLTISGVAAPDAGSYSVTVVNTLGSSDSEPAVLTVRDPAVVTQPASVTNNLGTTATFHVVAVGTPTLSYEWRKNGTTINDGGNYTGTTTDTLTVANLSATDEGSYSVLVTGGYNTSETSADAILTVVSPIAITAQPTPRMVTAGSRTVLAVGVSGTAPLFQWQLEGVDVTGATSAAYVLTNVQAGVTGNYRVVVTNSVNSEISSVAAVSVLTPLRLYSTNVVAIRIGDGAQTLTAHGNSMFLDQFAPGGAYVSTLNVPDSGPAAMVAIGPNVVLVPSSVTGSGMSRSANGRFLVIGGYNTNLSYTEELQSASAAVVPRGIGLIDDHGQYTLAISSTNSSSGNFLRGAVADGTNNYWGFSRTASTYYFGFDAPGVFLQTTWLNLRSMALFNGSIYGVSAVAGNPGVMRITGLPTAPATLEWLIDSSADSPSDCEVSPDSRLIYVADDRNAANGGGIKRWEFNGASWNVAYTLSDGLAAGARYVTADFSGPTPVLYAVTTEDSNNQIVRISDDGGGTGTVIAFAGANQTFRGLRLGPLATTNTTPPLLSGTSEPGNVILYWNGSFFLQSATNVAGIYEDVINGTRPHTNSTSSADQRFFRLRQ